MKFNTVMVGCLLTLGLLLTSCATPLSSNQPNLQQYPECKPYHCTRRHTCNYWQTTCYPACNETGANFCRTCH